MNQRTCPRPGCTKFVPAGVYACGPHWFELPLSVRQPISHAWAALVGERGNVVDGALRRMHLLAHARATAEAEQWWLANVVSPGGTLFGS